MNTFTPPDLYGIIGFPLGHSMSPLLHNTAFKTLGLPGVFLPWQLEPEKLPAFVEAVWTRSRFKPLVEFQSD